MYENFANCSVSALEITETAVTTLCSCSSVSVATQQRLGGSPAPVSIGCAGSIMIQVCPNQTTHPLLLIELAVHQSLAKGLVKSMGRWKY